MKRLATLEDFEKYIASFTNYERQQIPRYGPKTLKLERMRSLLADIGNPHHGGKAIHVAGSKGKGSTALILEALLAADGLTVGTYTSPHVERVEERIRLALRPISAADLVETADSLLPALERRRRDDPESFPTFFELMTAIALAYFARRRPDWSIFEVGLGGRLDATNVLSPAWTVITSVGLEHTRLLGTTHAAIAREKAGIVKPDTPLVVGCLPPEASDEVFKVARQQRAEVIVADPSIVLEPARPGRIHPRGFPAALPAHAIRGPALRADFAIAFTLYREILARQERRPTPETVSTALEMLELPARLELFDLEPPVLLDGAHTAESFVALHETLEEMRFPRPRTLLVSIASDKWVEAMLEVVPAIAEEVIFTRADPVRAFAPDELRQRLGSGSVVEDPVEAFRAASSNGRPLVVSGSMYLAGIVRPLLQKAT